jgi:flagellar biosynthesis protein FlhF
MSIKRFVAPSGREALAQVRRELGEDALVLSTRKLTGDRTEVLAVASGDMQALIEDSRSTREAQARAAEEAAKAAAESAPRVHAPSRRVQAESFASFLQRQAQSQAAAAEVTRAAANATRAESDLSHEVDQPVPAHGDAPAASAAAETEPMPAVFRRRGVPVADAATESEASAVQAPQARPALAPQVGASHTPPAIASPPAAEPQHAVQSAAAVSTVASPINGPAADARLLAELQTMRALLLEQMATMGATNAAAELHRRNPMQVRAMTRLLTAGLSPEVSRHIAERAPAAATPADSDRWLADVLALNVRCTGDDWIGRGGVYALVGPTGVGKTTTVAKLAARFAVRQGAQALGLITLDAFRVGAHEQLRAYGRILGTPVHLAQDMATLRDLLGAMAGKRLVLIDTCGVSQRDERLVEMMSMIDQAGAGQRPIERLLLLNAASHAETLDDVARAWRVRQSAGAVLTKLDEAARIGGALDCVLRHKLPVLGATNGQRVPEDWLQIDSQQLAAMALKPGQSSFHLAEAEGAVLGSGARQSGFALVGGAAA